MILFDEIWERIKKVTNLKILDDLARTISVSKPTVARKKGKNDFPVEWAFKVAQKFELNTDWIMTGKGQARIKQGSNLAFIQKVEKWIKEEEERQPGAQTWLEFDFRKKYPEFDKWEKREEGDSNEHIPADKRHIA